MFALFRFAVATAGLLFVTGFAHAQTDDNHPWDRFGIAVGGFVTESDTTVQINSKTLGVGAVIDLENGLGVDSKFDTFRVDMNYRFGESRRHEIEFHYFDSRRSGSRTLDQDLQIGDTLLPAGTGVNTDFDLTFANVDYVYNFLMDDRVRVGVSGGVHTTGIGLKIDTTAGASVEDESFTAPLPMVGLRADVILSQNWRLKMDVNFFYLEYDNYTGRLSDSLIAIEYRPWKHFGLGAGFNNIDYQVDADDSSSVVGLNGEIQFKLSGFMLYGKYFF